MYINFIKKQLLLLTGLAVLRRIHFFVEVRCSQELVEITHLHLASPQKHKTSDMSERMQGSKGHWYTSAWCEFDLIRVDCRIGQYSEGMHRSRPINVLSLLILAVFSTLWCEISTTDETLPNDNGAFKEVFSSISSSLILWKWVFHEWKCSIEVFGGTDCFMLQTMDKSLKHTQRRNAANKTRTARFHGDQRNGQSGGFLVFRCSTPRGPIRRVLALTFPTRRCLRFAWTVMERRLAPSPDFCRRWDRRKAIWVDECWAVSGDSLLVIQQNRHLFPERDPSLEIDDLRARGKGISWWISAHIRTEVSPNRNQRFHRRNKPHKGKKNWSLQHQNREFEHTTGGNELYVLFASPQIVKKKHSDFF